MTPLINQIKLGAPAHKKATPGYCPKGSSFPTGDLDQRLLSPWPHHTIDRFTLTTQVFSQFSWLLWSITG